jgi:L-rhamnose isomerase / sugar isomerase
MNISDHNGDLLGKHQRHLQFLTSEVSVPTDLIQKLKDFQIAIPSWALGTGGTRFGRFSAGGNQEI